eukprot:Skav214151  [mRNA]  locus=scaffold1645:270597:273360:- [translate_table: standard]
MGRVGYRGNMVLATCAGACMQLTTLPLQNHSTRMQTQTEKRGNWATAVAMYREEGLGAFYKGAGDPQIEMYQWEWDSRWSLFDFISMSSKDHELLLDLLVSEWQVGLTAGQAFWLGLISKLIASTICYPLTRIKQMCQAQTKRSKLRRAGEDPNASDGKPLSMWEMSVKVWASDGWNGFVYGIEGQVFNASLKAALHRSAKERIQAPERPRVLKLVEGSGGSNWLGQIQGQLQGEGDDCWLVTTFF